jgi:hypothetical protein
MEVGAWLYISDEFASVTIPQSEKQPVRRNAKQDE